MVLPNHNHVWINITIARDHAALSSNMKASFPADVNKPFTKHMLELEKKRMNNAATDTAVMIFGRYITTLKKPWPGMCSLESVNQTASNRDKRICGMKLPIQRIKVFPKSRTNSAWIRRAERSSPPNSNVWKFCKPTKVSPSEPFPYTLKIKVLISGQIWKKAYTRKNGAMKKYPYLA